MDCRREVHWPNSERRELVDLDMGEAACSSSKMAYGWRSSTAKHIAPGRKCSQCRSLNSLSPKAMREQMSLQKRERVWTEEKETGRIVKR